MPKFYDKEKWGAYLLSLIGTILLLYLIQIGGDYLLGFSTYIDQHQQPFLSPEYKRTLFAGGILISISALPFKTGINWYKQLILENQFENQRVKAELKLIKTKLSPDFLLPILKKIQELIDVRSPQAAPMILKLSEVMRYMLYETKEDKVSIQKELDNIQSYISLQKMKVDFDLNLQLEISDKTEGLYIEPLFLMPFLEGYLKVCNSTPDAEVGINISLHKNEFHLGLKNNCKLDTILISDVIQDLKKLLKIHYPARHQLINDQQAVSNSLSLVLTLNH